MNAWTGKKVLIFGMARSGMASAELLCRHEAVVSIYDQKAPEEVDDKIGELSAYPIEYLLGSKDLGRAQLKKFETIILSPGIDPMHPTLCLAREMGIEIIGELELAYLFAKAPIIAITGTNGKTTTTTLCSELMAKAVPGSQAGGNIGVAYSSIVEEIVAPAYAILEISSFQLMSVRTFHAHIAALLNITPDHLNRHKTMENYIAAKATVFQHQTAEDFAVLNADDEYCRRIGASLMQKENGPRVFFFAHQKAKDVAVWAEEGYIMTNLNGTTERVAEIGKMQIFGPHNEENAFAAVACAILAGMRTEDVAKPLYDFKGVEHRIEFTAEVDGVRYYNDSKATNPDSAIKGLLAMTRPTVLLGGGYDKQIPFDEWCVLFEKRVKHLILFGETKEDIYNCAIRCGYAKEKITVVKNLKEAVEEAHRIAECGDAVLLSPACASWDQFESFEARGRDFKEMVHQL